MFRLSDSIAAQRLRLVATWALLLAANFVAVTNSAHAQRSLGIDVSAWQGNLSAFQWNRLHTVDNQDFVFIRSSRGGTTGFYNQSNPNNNNGENTLSQRYDDPYFVQNVTRATNAGLLAGSYHYSRPDIVSNTGVDEADHFIEMAGAWMRPGYLLPVHDLEAGQGVRTNNQLAQFTLDFSDRIHEVMGIRPAIYINGNYARYVIGGASSTLRQQVVEAHPVLWNARPESNADVQTEHPSEYLSWTYGAWDDPPNPAQPWDFWQYSWTGNLFGFNGDLDLNVAQGGMEYLKDRLVPALWTTAGDGDWSTLANWNSGQTPIAPVQGPGQVPRVGGLTLPAVRLPTEDDTVILDRADADIAVTLSSGDHEIRKLVVREALNLTGGSLTVNYVPTAESTPYSAQFSAPVSLSSGSLSAHTLQVEAAQTFSLGGVLTVDTLQLMPHSVTPAKIVVTDDVSISPLDSTAASIVAGAAAGSPGFIDLGGASRAFQVPSGNVSIEVPIINGGLTKDGFGALELSGANTYAGDTSVETGALNIDTPFLNDAADVYLTTLSTLQLDFVGTDVIDALFIDGVSQPVGTWGGLGSAADFTTPFIEGAGFLQVSNFESPLVGDFNRDGSVDSDDLSQWQEDIGMNGESDADGDGDSDGLDFLAWQRNLGSTLGAVSATQAIPEPSTILLLVGCVTLAGRLRWA